MREDEAMASFFYRRQLPVIENLMQTAVYQKQSEIEQDRSWMLEFENFELSKRTGEIIM